MNEQKRTVRAASIPLVTHDPYFSIWSSSDCLYDSETVHWSGTRQKMNGYLIVDGKHYNFMGKRMPYEILPQVSVQVTATCTKYFFENEKVALTLKFLSPLLPDDMLLVSRPCTYVEFEIEKKNCMEVELHLEVYADLVRTSKDLVLAHNNQWDKDGVSYFYVTMGRAKQEPLNASEDKITIDWGYAYLASDHPEAKLFYEPSYERMSLAVPIQKSKESVCAILAYDDLVSICYFGQWRRAYWTSFYSTIFDAIGAAFADRVEVKKRAEAFDRDMEEKARLVGGEDYVYLCNLSYRQSVSAHKLITDEEGNILFLSKENDSNGCIGTVDVSYPSVPLFFMYDTEYIKGMLRPIFKFEETDVWNYDFAPHDVGRYPYAWGQAYGARTRSADRELRYAGPVVHPPYFMYPAACDIFDYSYQMPVEECGNMLILCAEICERERSADFVRPYIDTLRKWKDYLIQYGADPGDQLCTDDFAGHLAHNVNLSVKAILGIEAFGRIAGYAGETQEKETCHKIAMEMAADWTVRANAGDHYRLTFDRPESWSLKYNLIWDKLWESNLFEPRVYEEELAYYEGQMLPYGVPLDSRTTQTKSDWQLWIAAMTEDANQRKRLIAPVAAYLRETATRVPFGDWYNAENARYYRFIARSVQGGIFMPMYRFLRNLEK